MRWSLLPNHAGRAGGRRSASAAEAMAGPHFRAPHVLEADGKTPVATRRRPIPALSLSGRVRGAERWIGRPVSASELEQPSVGVVPLGTIHRCGGSVGPTAIAESRTSPDAEFAEVRDCRVPGEAAPLSAGWRQARSR